MAVRRSERACVWEAAQLACGVGGARLHGGQVEGRLHGGQGELEATKEGVGVSTAARSNASGSKDESRSSRDAEMTPEQVNDAELQQVC